MDSIRNNLQGSINNMIGNQPGTGERQYNPEIKTIGSKEFPIQKEIDRKDLKDSLDKANQVLFKNNTHLKFEIHDKTKDVMVKVIHDETGETLKEFPPEKILDMVAKLWEIAGLFVDEKR